MRALFTLMVALLGIVLSGQAWAELSQAEKCMNGCAAKHNVCLNVDMNASPPKLPDLGVCGDVDECKSVAKADMDAYASWILGCLKEPGTCHNACVPPSPPSPPPSTTSTTVQPPAPRPPMSYADMCRYQHGYPVEGKCWRIGDAYRELQELKQKIGNGQLDPGLYQHIYILTTVVNNHTAFLTEARKVVDDYDRLRKQVENHETRLGTAEHNIRVNAGEIAGLKGQLGLQPQPVAPGQPPQSTTKLVFTGNGGRLPCWIGAFGQLHAHEIYGRLLGSAGGELGCSLFGTEDGRTNMIFGAGASYATNSSTDHKRYALHVLAGPQFRVGDSWKILIPLAAMRVNTWSFERGSNSWYGVLPEVRYLFSKERWSPFVGVRVGLGATHYAHPTVPGVQDTRFDPTFWGVAGIEFDPFNTASSAKK